MSDTAGPWEKEKLAALLEAAKSAIGRCRWIFGAINVAAVLILSSVFNQYLPYMRYTYQRAQHSTDKEALKVLTDFVWGDLSTVSIPLLGIKFSAFDLAVIGAVGMAVLTMWLYYAVRREHHVISQLADEAERTIDEAGGRGKADYLLSAVAHNFVFINLTTLDRPSWPVGVLLRVLLYSPAWVLVAIVAGDLSSLFIPSPFEIAPGPLDQHLVNDWETFEISARCVFCLAVAAVCGFTCHECQGLEAKTIERLESIRDALKMPGKDSDLRLASAAIA
jgi:hypothetical protein